MRSMSTPSIIETRRDQIFLTLEQAEIERVRRFGEVCCCREGPMRELWPRRMRCDRGPKGSLLALGRVGEAPARQRRAVCRRLARGDTCHSAGETVKKGGKQAVKAGQIS